MCSKRLTSPCGVYHITSKGAGGQIIFEDAADNRHFLALLKNACVENEIRVAAWCLMGNHFHLLLHAPLENISKAMQQLKRIYSRDTNRRYGRTGHLFQGKFASFPIDDESYFAAAIRYIHNNPVRAGIANNPAEYPWSSYQEYLGKRFLLDDALMLDIGANNSQCLDYIDDNAATKRAMYNGSKRMTDEQAAKYIKDRFAISTPTLLKGFEIESRNRALAELCETGMLQSQIARLTGVSKSSISRAVNLSKKAKR